MNCFFFAEKELELNYVGNPQIKIIDTIKIKSNSFVQYIDYSEVREEILLREMDSNKLILFDLDSRRVDEIDLFGDHGDLIGNKLTAGSYFHGDTIFFTTEKGFFEYILKTSEVRKIFMRHKRHVNNVFIKVVPFGDNNTVIISDEVCMKDFTFTGDYNSLDFLSTVKYFNMVDLREETVECVIGNDKRSIQLTIDDNFRFFPDGEVHFTSYKDETFAFLSNADTKVFIYSAEQIDLPRLINYKLKFKYRNPIKKMPLEDFDSNWLKVKNGRVWTLTGTEVGDIIVCYSHGLPDATRNFKHDIKTLKRSCVVIDADKSTDKVTYQSPDFPLPKGVSGFVGCLSDDRYILANDGFLNEQAGETYLYIAKIVK